MRDKTKSHQKGVAVDGPLDGKTVESVYKRIVVPVIMGYIETQPYFETGVYTWEDQQKVWRYEAPRMA